MNFPPKQFSAHFDTWFVAPTVRSPKPPWPIRVKALSGGIWMANMRMEIYTALDIKEMQIKSQ